MRNKIRRWRALWNPDMFHGWGRRQGYFEGWYFKLVDAGEQYAFALIPGIAVGDGESHAFIQVLDGKRCTAEYIRYEATAFRPSADRFAIEVGDNYFDAGTLRIDLPRLKGELVMRGRRPWPRMLGAPGIMGWYSFVPFMECYHGVVSLDHELAGTLDIDGRPVDFTGGRGYTEKDWGRSFPSSWIWMQSNHFGEAAPVSLTASIARIPWIGSHFIGYIVGFLFEGTLHRFATYTGAMMRARLLDGGVELAFRDRHRRLKIRAQQGPGGTLLSPLSGEMNGKVNESMQGRLEVCFFEDERLRFAGTGRHAGLELAGPVEELLTETWRR